jgi:hypothetical protein
MNPIRFIKRKWQELGFRWTREWRTTTIDSFQGSLELLNTSLVMVGLIGGLTLIVPIMWGTIPFSVAGLFVAHWICLPTAITGFVLQLGLNKGYLDRVRRHTNVYWNDTRVDRLKYVLTRLTIWMTVLYLSMFLFWLSSPLWSSIFIGSLLTDLIAVKMLLVGVFWIPVCLMQVFVTSLNMWVAKFRVFILREDIREIENRYDRQSDSMQDDVTDDELLDYKLQRMGL